MANRFPWGALLGWLVLGAIGWLTMHMILASEEKLYKPEFAEEYNMAYGAFFLFGAFGMVVGAAVEHSHEWKAQGLNLMVPIAMGICGLMGGAYLGMVLSDVLDLGKRSLSSVFLVGAMCTLGTSTCLAAGLYGFRMLSPPAAWFVAVLLIVQTVMLRWIRRGTATAEEVGGERAFLLLNGLVFAVVLWALAASLLRRRA